MHATVALTVCPMLCMQCSVCDRKWFYSWTSQTCERCADTGNHSTSISVSVMFFMFAGVFGLLVMVMRFHLCSFLVEAFVLRLGYLVLLCKNVYLVTKVKSLVLVVTLQVINQFEVITSSTSTSSDEAGGPGYPSFAANLAKGLGVFNFDLIGYAPPECVNPSATFYSKLFIKTTGPLMVLAVLWMPPLARLARRTWRGELRGERLGFRSAGFWSLLLFELILPSVSTTISETFVCRTFDDGSKFLRVQLNLACDGSSDRNFWVSWSVVFFVLFPIG